jgi:hypothetical protein
VFRLFIFWLIQKKTKDDFMTMKQLLALLLLGSLSVVHAQTDVKKLQLGAGYSLTHDHEMSNNPFSGYVDYQVKEWGALGVYAGVRVFYFDSKIEDNFSDVVGWNPYVRGSYAFSENAFQAYFSIGYYRDSSEFTSTPVFPLPTRTEKLHSNGVTFTPGIRYFVIPNFFVDSNVTILQSQSDSGVTASGSNNQVFFNIGVGVAF